MIEFSFKQTENQRKNRIIKYVLDEYSFNMFPIHNKSLPALLIKSINIVFDHNSKSVVDFWGYCPYTNWVKMSLYPPKSICGELLINSELECNEIATYHIADKWQIRHDSSNGWICIGEMNLLKHYIAIEFQPNIIAVLDNVNLTALWIKPQFDGNAMYY